MITIRKTTSIEDLADLKKRYLQETTAPLDGMWLIGFVPMANHFTFYDKDTLAGYCCLNDEGYLLQFYLCPQQRQQQSLVFKDILEQENSVIPRVNGAFASTAEPNYLSLCFDYFNSSTEHTYMYQLAPGATKRSADGFEPQLRPLDESQLADVVEFAKTNVRAPEGWLSEYYSNLIRRGELFGLYKDGQLIAAGESRSHDEIQTRYGDVGLIVDGSERGKGIGTQVMTELVYITEQKGLKPICSTEKENAGAQKAITRAGFVASNQIMQFD